MADNVKCSELCRWVISPGYVLSLKLPPPVSHVGENPPEEFQTSLNRDAGIGLAVNFAYYYLLLWIGLIAFSYLRPKMLP
jgi:hypothetical protein